MGIFGGTPQLSIPEAQPAPEPEPVADDLDDPEARARARKRAEEAAQRANRRKLIIPLGTVNTGESGTGLSIK